MEVSGDYPNRRALSSNHTEYSVSGATVDMVVGAGFGR
jgi:hypothetical protein